MSFGSVDRSPILAQQRHKREIERYLSKVADTSAEARRFMDDIRKAGRLFLIGGAIRDIINKKNPRDIDFVIIPSKPQTYEKLVKKYKCSRNRFQGYKFQFGTVSFDLWEFGKTWAFQKGILKERPRNLARTAFFDLDGLVFDLEKQVLYKKRYNEAAREKRLSIINALAYDVQSNPDPELNLVKALRLKKSYALSFSDDLTMYFSSVLRHKNRKQLEMELLAIEKRYYGSQSILTAEDIRNALSYKHTS